MKKNPLRPFVYRYLLPYGGWLLVKILSSTYKIRIVAPENEKRILVAGGSLIYASWHQRFFPGIAFFSTRKPIAIMISQSRDGEFMAHIADMLGWFPVRGSSSRGGPEALRKLKDLARSGYKIGHIVDGPQGPPGVVKSGLIRIAQVAEIPIVPTVTSAERKWTFNSWDRFMVPKPFARIIVRFGTPIAIPADLNNDSFEKERLRIEQTMKQMYEDTDRIWKDRCNVSEIFNRS